MRVVLVSTPCGSSLGRHSELRSNLRSRWNRVGDLWLGRPQLASMKFTTLTTWSPNFRDWFIRIVVQEITLFLKQKKRTKIWKFTVVISVSSISHWASGVSLVSLSADLNWTNWCAYSIRESVYWVHLAIPKLWHNIYIQKNDNYRATKDLKLNCDA